MRRVGCAQYARLPADYKEHFVNEDLHDEGLRGRLSRQGEETLGKIAEELAGNPLVTGALSRALEAREKALQAQKAEVERAEALEGRLEEIGRDIEALRRAVAPGEEPPPRAQERLTVTEA